MIKDLETAIGYRFKNISLLQNALTHSSYANEHWHNSLRSNERLEFLGDSILGMVVAEYLYKSFPDRPEGELTRMRADMVCEKTLAAVAMAAKVQGRPLPEFPQETAIGALGLYISDSRIENFQPMNVNFSIIPPLEKRIKKKAEKNLALAQRSLQIVDDMIARGI